MKTLLPVLMAAVACSSNLERQEHHEDIYVIHGPASDLEHLRDSIGDSWAGGKFIDYDRESHVLRYWAYSTRSAAEARIVLLPAVLADLDVKIEEYDEAHWYPVERGKLDDVTRACGENNDPFFLTPIREVRISFSKGANEVLRRCLWDGASKMGIPVFEAEAITK